MGFSIPNYNEAPFPGQAEPDSRDFVALREGIDGNGVLTGCDVTAQVVPDMTVEVAAGTIQMVATPIAVAGGTVTVGAADPTNGRYDLILANNDGTVSDQPGTASQVPTFPTYDVTISVLVAAVFVPAVSTVVDTDQVTDKRVIVVNASGGGTVLSVNSGQAVDVDNTDPTNPVVNIGGTLTAAQTVASSGAGAVAFVDGGSGDSLTIQPPFLFITDVSGDHQINVSPTQLQGFGLAASQWMGAGRSGEATFRVTMTVEGTFGWGDGAGATDTDLFRDGVAVLRTTGEFVAGLIDGGGP